MVAERTYKYVPSYDCCSLAKISMVAEHITPLAPLERGCSLAKISMVAELRRVLL